MDETTSAAVDWLLHSDEPAIRRLTRRDVLGEPTGDGAGSADGPMVSALLSGQRADGGFGGHPYHKWTGAHWRLISLAELEVPAADPRVAAVVERVLTWISRGLRQSSVVGADGLIRSHASIQGNALGAGCRFGRADDPRAHAVVEALISWQWRDGGWNCDQKATGYRSSFHETLGPAWGLHEYAAATGDSGARAAADRAAELFLEHRLFRRLRTGEVIKSQWLRPRYPPYWHYDILQALLVLSRMGKATDPRAADALDELERRRQPDGRWRASGQWWRRSDSRSASEVVDWGRSGEPNPMITLNALRVLRAAGRL